MKGLLDIGYKSFIMIEEIESIHEYQRNHSKTKAIKNFIENQEHKFDHIPVVDCTSGNKKRSIIICKNGTVYYSFKKVDTLRDRICKINQSNMNNYTRSEYTAEGNKIGTETHTKVI